MDLTDVGHAIATRYNIVLASLSPRMAHCYLPLRAAHGGPPDTVAFINHIADARHFVPVLTTTLCYPLHVQLDVYILMCSCILT